MQRSSQKTVNFTNSNNLQKPAEMAMVTTMRMWYMAMNGQMERAESLFLEAEIRQGIDA